MSIFLTRYRIRAMQSDLQRVKAKEASANAIAWLWIFFIVFLCVAGLFI